MEILPVLIWSLSIFFSVAGICGTVLIVFKTVKEIKDMFQE